MRAKRTGRTLVVCHNPIHAEIYCEIMFTWRLTDELIITDEKILTFCDQRAHEDEPIPDWINYDLVKEEILEYELD